MRFTHVFLALILVLSLAQLALAQTVPADPLTSAFAQLGPWGIAVAALILYAGPKLLPLFKQRVEAEAALASDHTKFMQDLVDAFRADLAKKDAAFLTALGALVERVHEVESTLARLVDRFPADPPRAVGVSPPPPSGAGAPAPLQEAAHAA